MSNWFEVGDFNSFQELLQKASTDVISSIENSVNEASKIIAEVGNLDNLQQESKLPPPAPAEAIINETNSNEDLYGTERVLDLQPLALRLKRSSTEVGGLDNCDNYNALFESDSYVDSPENARTMEHCISTEPPALMPSIVSGPLTDSGVACESMNAMQDTTLSTPAASLINNMATLFSLSGIESTAGSERSSRAVGDKAKSKLAPDMAVQSSFFDRFEEEDRRRRAEVASEPAILLKERAAAALRSPLAPIVLLSQSLSPSPRQQLDDFGVARNRVNKHLNNIDIEQPYADSSPTARHDIYDAAVKNTGDEDSSLTTAATTASQRELQADLQRISEFIRTASMVLRPVVSKILSAVYAAIVVTYELFTQVSSLNWRQISNDNSNNDTLFLGSGSSLDGATSGVSSSGNVIWHVLCASVLTCLRSTRLLLQDVWSEESRRNVSVSCVVDRLWEIMTSAVGVAVLTGALLMYAYVKFRRYGTDAGD